MCLCTPLCVLNSGMLDVCRPPESMVESLDDLAHMHTCDRRLLAYRAPKRRASKERPAASTKRCRVLRLQSPQPAGGAGQSRGQQGWASAGRAAKGTDKVSVTAIINGVPLLWC